MMSFKRAWAARVDAAFRSELGAIHINAGVEGQQEWGWHTDENPYRELTPKEHFFLDEIHLTCRTAYFRARLFAPPERQELMNRNMVGSMGSYTRGSTTRVTRGEDGEPYRTYERTSADERNYAGEGRFAMLRSADTRAHLQITQQVCEQFNSEMDEMNDPSLIARFYCSNLSTSGATLHSAFSIGIDYNGGLYRSSPAASSAVDRPTRSIPIERPTPPAPALPLRRPMPETSPTLLNLQTFVSANEPVRPDAISSVFIERRPSRRAESLVNVPSSPVVSQVQAESPMNGLPSDITDNVEFREAFLRFSAEQRRLFLREFSEIPASERQDMLLVLMRLSPDARIRLIERRMTDDDRRFLRSLSNNFLIPLGQQQAIQNLPLFTAVFQSEEER
jgi:hypothetical protein